MRLTENFLSFTNVTSRERTITILSRYPFKIETLIRDTKLILHTGGVHMVSSVHVESYTTS